MTRVWGWESDACQPTHGDNTIHLTCHGLNTATRPSPSSAFIWPSSGHQSSDQLKWIDTSYRYLLHSTIWQTVKRCPQGQNYICIFSPVLLTPVHTLHTLDLNFWSGQIHVDVRPISIFLYIFSTFLYIFHKKYFFLWPMLGKVVAHCDCSSKLFPEVRLILGHDGCTQPKPAQFYGQI